MPHANHSHGPHIRIRRVLGEGPLAGETARQAKSERCLYRDRPPSLQSPRDSPRRAPRRVNFSLIDFGDFACIYDNCAMQRMRYAHGTNALWGLLIWQYRSILHCNKKKLDWKPLGSSGPLKEMTHGLCQPRALAARLRTPAIPRPQGPGP